MFALWMAIGLAGTLEDVGVAGNRDLAVEERQPAFDRLVSGQDVTGLVELGKNTDRTVSERWVAIRALGLIPTIEARQALVDFLDHGDVWARIAAAGAAGERGDRSMAGKVAVRLSDPAILVRAAAAEALTKLKDPSTLGDLERALKDPSSWYRGTSLWIRRKYVEAMASVGVEGGPYLARALEDKDPVVSAAALRGLEQVAGFSYKEGRTAEEEKEAWRRWAGK